MRHPKILVAEDDPRRAYFFQVSLESAGFQVLQAADSANAWRIIQAQKLVMALIDAKLPGLSDRNVLLRVRADPSLTKLPVLILGESLCSEEATEWLNLGADDYVSRAISPQLLMARVHAKLRRSKPLNQSD
ncbi:MAG: response regulator [Chloroflexota bacterium]|nr:response regulator [Chloroflexota bacterium]